MNKAKRNWLLFGAGVAFAVLVVGVLLSNFILVSMEYDKAKKEYIAAGLPFEAKDMLRDIPKEENAAQLLAKYKHSSAVISANRNLEDVQANTDKLKALLGDRKVELDEVVKASEFKQLDWQTDWSLGSYMDLDKGMPLKYMVQDLGVRAEIKSIEGDLKGALSDFRAMCRISEMASQEPTLIALLVSISLRAIVCSYARKIGSHRLNNPEFLRAMSDELATIQAGPDMANAIRGEAYFNIWYLRNLKLLGGWIKALSQPDDYFSEMEEPKYKGPFAAEGEIRGLAAKAMAVKTFKFYKELYSILKEDQNWFTANPRISKQVDEAIKDESLSGKLLSGSVSIYDQILNAPAKSQATVLTTRAALLLMAAKAEGKGKLQIKDLQGDWLDHYTGKPLLSMWSGNVVKVWSVGEDGKDDGGSTMNPSGFGPAQDVVSEMPFAKVKPVGLTGPGGGPPSAG